eukprot:14281846-Alexandrium_andersonii.AAC.1
MVVSINNVPECLPTKAKWPNPATWLTKNAIPEYRCETSGHTSLSLSLLTQAMNENSIGNVAPGRRAMIHTTT